MQLKEIIKKALIFTLLFIVLDYMGGLVLEYLFNNQKSGMYYRANYGFYQSEADVFIFGSSNANHHIVPSVFHDSLELTAYNMGKDGMDILYHYSMFKGIINRHTPKIVVLSLTPTELSSNDSYERLSALLPYIKSDEEIKKIAMLKSKHEPIKAMSGIYPYNSMITTLLKGFRGTENTKEDGYVPLYGTKLSKDYVPFTFKGEKGLDSLRIHYYEKMIKTCKEKNIVFCTVLSPWFFVEDFNTQTINVVNELSMSHKTLVVNYTSHPQFTGIMESFYDEGHLNHPAAINFTAEIIQHINAFTNDHLYNRFH